MPAVDWLVPLTLRSTAVLVVALALVAVLRRFPAMARHRVLTLTATSLLLLPALPGLLPRWELRLPAPVSLAPESPFVVSVPEPPGLVARDERAALVPLHARPGGTGGPDRVLRPVVRDSRLLRLAGRRPGQPGRARSCPPARGATRRLWSAPPRTLDGDAGDGPSLARAVTGGASSHQRADRGSRDRGMETARRAPSPGGGAVVRGEEAGGPPARAGARAERRRAASPRAGAPSSRCTGSIPWPAWPSGRRASWASTPATRRCWISARGPRPTPATCWRSRSPWEPSPGASRAPFRWSTAVSSKGDCS